MARQADMDSSARPSLRAGMDDAWFDESGALPLPVSDKKARLVLGGVLVVLLLLGLVLGAFAGGGADPGPELERWRERARAAASPTPLSAGGEEALLDGLDRLVTTWRGTEPQPVMAPQPTPDAADAVGDAGDGGQAAEAQVDAAVAEAGPVASAEPKDEPRAPAKPKANDAKLIVPGATAPKAEPKVEPPKVEEPKAESPKVEDPKLKAPLDQALADAKALLDSGRWGEAKAAYEKVLAMSPGNPRALLGRGRATLELKQVQPALKDIKGVLEAEPRNPTALLLAGSISQELGQKDVARGYYQRYLDAWPSGRKAAEVKALLERL